MADSLYSYAITGGTSTFPNKQVDTAVLTTEILASSITATLDYINTDALANTCTIYFLTALSGGETTTLNNVIANHQAIAPTAVVPTTVDTPGTAIDGRIAVENGTSGASFRQSLVGIDSSGSVNVPTGQKYKINNVALAKGDITGITNSDTPTFTNVNLTGLTASSVVLTDASKNLTATAAAGSAFNQNFEASTTNIKMNGTQALGALSTIARADHVHPSDTTRATLVATPTNGDILTTNGSGQPIDSGKKFNDAGSTVNDIWSASQVSTAINNGIGTNNAMVYKGTIDCSANPNYPAASIGWTYVVSVAGKIGGASGTVVEVSDMIICQVANAGGTQAAVGANFNIIQANINGAVTSADTTSVATNIVVESGVTGKVVQQSLAKVTAGGAINIPTGQTYQINGTALAQANITGLTTADSPTFTNVTHSGLTANTALISNGSKTVASSAVTSTELGYVSGVTSALQTQINGKEPTISPKNTAFNVNFETVAGVLVANGTASVGSATTTVRADHKHPADTTKVDKVAGSVANNLVSFNDTTGVVKDSGITASSVSTAITNAHTHANKANLDLIDQSLATTASPTFGNITDSGLTASQIVQTDGTKKLVSVAPATAYNQAFEASTANIKMNGTVAVGSLSTIARADHIHASDTTREPAITIGSTSQYWRGDKSWQTLDNSAVGLGAVTNDAQLKRAAGDFNSFSGITPILTDVLLIEDASASYAKGKVLLSDVQTLIVPVFGQNYAYSNSEALSTTTSTSMQNKVTLSVTGIPAGNYRIACSFAWYETSTTRFFQARIYQDATTSLWNMYAAPSSTSTSVFNPESGVWQGALAAGNHSFTLDYCSSNASGTAGIQLARLEFWRIS